MSIYWVKISSIGPHKHNIWFTNFGIMFEFKFTVEIQERSSGELTAQYIVSFCKTSAIFLFIIRIINNSNYWKPIKLLYSFSNIEGHIYIDTVCYNEFIINKLLNYFTGSTAFWINSQIQWNDLNLITMVVTTQIRLSCLQTSRGKVEHNPVSSVLYHFYKTQTQS